MMVVMSSSVTTSCLLRPFSTNTSLTLKLAPMVMKILPPRASGVGVLVGRWGYLGGGGGGRFGGGRCGGRCGGRGGGRGGGRAGGLFATFPDFRPFPSLLDWPPVIFSPPFLPSLPALAISSKRSRTLLLAAPVAVFNWKANAFQLGSSSDL